MSLIQTSNGSCKITAELNPLQEIVMQSAFTSRFDQKNINELGVFGGFGNGKSFILMLIAYILAIKYDNSRILFIRTQTTDLEQSVINQFHEMFPPELSGYEYRVQKKLNIFINGSHILFKGYNMSNYRDIRSNMYDAIFMCQAEEIPYPVFLECLARLRGTAMPYKTLYLEGNPSDCWVKDRYVTPKKLPLNCIFLEAATGVNAKNLPENYIERMKDTYSEKEIQRLVYGSWDSTSFLIHPDFDEMKHVFPEKEIDPAWHHCIGFDHGMIAASCMLWMARDHNDVVHVYDEWYQEEATFEEIQNASQKNGYLPIHADYSMKSVTKGGLSLWEDFENAGMKLIEAEKHDKKGSIMLINKRLLQRKIIIHSNCKNLISQIKRYQWKRPNYQTLEDPKDQVLKVLDHACDAFQYGIRGLEKMGIPSDPNIVPFEDTIAGKMLAGSKKDLVI